MSDQPAAPRSKLPFIAGGLLLVLVVAVAYAITRPGGLSLSGIATGSGHVTAPDGQTLQLNGSGQSAPDFRGISDWENSRPLKMSELRGQVVLVDFWTYSCINCQRTFPYLRQWYRAYKDSGFVIVGVHSPEFDFEKSVPNIRQAIQRYGVEWPVAVDSSMDTWNAYANQYWPAEYFIDKNGTIRHMHFGEGEYDQSEKIIQALLKEAGHTTNAAGAAGLDPGLTSDSQVQTRELYAAAGRGFDIPDERAGQAYDYHDPGPDQGGHRRNNHIYFNGQWNIGQEYAEHARDAASGRDYVTIDYLARQVFMVAATGAGAQRAYLTLDGHDIGRGDAGDDVQFDTAGHSYVDVDRSDLYKLVKRPDFAEHVLQVSPTGRGFRLFTFTFGS